MQAYGLMVNLRPDQAEAVRRTLIDRLKTHDGSEQSLAIEGLKFLRKQPLSRSEARA
jgi:hypothetical protein